MSGLRIIVLTLCLAGAAVLGVTLIEWVPGEREAATPGARRMPDPPPVPPDTVSDTEYFAAVCAVCHGSRGEGNVALKTPSIAGQPGWYLKAQLNKFRNGQRGTHPDDEAGKQMRAIALVLPPERIDGLVAVTGSMSPLPTRRTIEGDAANGELVYGEQCMECHRYNGQGERVFRSSPLTTFQDWYLASELAEFRDGIRGHVAGDIDGKKMRDVVRYLRPADLRDVVAYLSTLATNYPPGR